MSKNKSKKSKSKSSPKLTRKSSPKSPLPSYTAQPIPSLSSSLTPPRISMPPPSPRLSLSPPPMSLTHTTISHKAVKACSVPYLYLDPINESIFQVSFTDMDDIVFKNTTKNSSLDCGYKALVALGLRNKYINEINSRMVNSRGTIGILLGDFAAYIEHIYDIPTNSIDYIKGVSLNPSTIMHTLTNFVNHLEESHATILVVDMDTFSHFIVACKYQGIVYYYNPQTNTPGKSIDKSMSTDLIHLLKEIYPTRNLKNWGGFVILTQGHPKPVIKNRLKSFLKFVGGGKPIWVNHSA